jgi:TatD DNase family protein
LLIISIFVFHNEYKQKVSVLKFIDTHTHIYLEQFDNDRPAAIGRARQAGISHMLMPNIDSQSVAPMLAVAEDYPDMCIPMMALHPTSVKENYQEELDVVDGWLRERRFVAVGETGMDLYWDSTFSEQQKDSLARHVSWAVQYNLPLVLHARNSLDELFDVLTAHRHLSFTGVFHCFPGNARQAARVLDMGFMLGIGGVVTYKKSLMPEVIKFTGLDNIILETDAPYLAPVPHRGKRNESAFLTHIAEKIAEIAGVDVEEVATSTTANARKLFKI